MGSKIKYVEPPREERLIGQRVTHHRVADLRGTIVDRRHSKGAFRDTKVSVRWDTDIYGAKPDEWWDLGNVAFSGEMVQSLPQPIGTRMSGVIYSRDISRKKTRGLVRVRDYTRRAAKRRR